MSEATRSPEYTIESVLFLAFELGSAECKSRSAAVGGRGLARSRSG